MCEVCGSTIGHLNGCPEAQQPLPEVYGTCEICGEDILEGQDYFDMDDKFVGGKAHYDCFCDKYLVNG